MNVKQTRPTSDFNGIIGTPFPGSTKHYVRTEKGWKIPFRKVKQQHTKNANSSETIANPDIIIYDSSGPFTDPKIEINLSKGILETRSWIKEYGNLTRLENFYEKRITHAIRGSNVFWYSGITFLLLILTFMGFE